jgi:thiol-disulfide isomerase/thioredoxin
MKSLYLNHKLTFFAVTIMVCCTYFWGCITIPNRFSSLAPGYWRAELQLEDKGIAQSQLPKNAFEKMNVHFEEATGGALPFLMEVKYLNDTAFTIEIINATERILVNSNEIAFGRDRKTGKDTLMIRFPIYDSYIKAIYNEKVIEGDWIMPVKKLSIPFVARNGQNHRFTTLAKKPAADLSGSWETTFGVGDSVPEKAIGQFKQNGNQLTGTFRTETGDYRFLEGEIQADKVYLSCFDGTHAYLFEAKWHLGDTISGIFRSGRSAPTIWQAVRNPSFQLRKADSLTFLKPGYSSLDFKFKTPEGAEISPNMPEFQGKIKIIQIMGSWCPNCRDESRFLVGYLRDNPSIPVAVIGLAFERSPENANELIKTYRAKMNIPYPIAIAGTSTKKEEAAKALPALNHVMSFPTTIFIDKKGMVRRIHTGFDGPATNEYPQFVQSFDAFVKQLAAEK